MTDEEQKELGLSNKQRTIYEYYENHPEDLEKLAKAIQPVTEAIADIVVKISEALKPIIDALVPIIIDALVPINEVMPVEELDDYIDDEEDSEDD